MRINHIAPLKKVLRRNKFKVIEVNLRNAHGEHEPFEAFCNAVEKVGIPAKEIATKQRLPNARYLYGLILHALHKRNQERREKTVFVFHLPREWTDRHPAYEFMLPILKPGTYLERPYMEANQTVKNVAVYHGETLPSGGFVMIFGECAHVPTK